MGVVLSLPSRELNLSHLNVCSHSSKMMLVFIAFNRTITFLNLRYISFAEMKASASFSRAAFFTALWHVTAGHAQVKLITLTMPSTSQLHILLAGMLKWRGAMINVIKSTCSSPTTSQNGF